MFPTDAFLKNAHDLTLAAKMVRNGEPNVRADKMPESQADRPTFPQRFVLALAAVTPIVVGLAWAVLS